MIRLNEHNNQLNLLGIILHTVNQLIMTSAITKQSPLPQPSSNLHGKKIRKSGLETSHTQFSITLERKYQYQLIMIQLMQKHI